ncbi:MAG: glycosyltransferase family 4 protein [Deltaproteobacteria bacterium]|nr:glycosyltransferase family 4 protein [Deltaproteobacteria bacterium]
MKHRPLRIAFIGARGVGSRYSGIETYYEEVGSRLAARGHEVTAYCRNYFTPDIATLRGVHVRRLPCIRSKHLETITHSLLSTFDSFRQPFDVIQFHAIGSAPLSLLPRLFGRTTVLSVRGLDWQRAKWGGFARGVLKFGEWASAHCPTATVVVSRTLQEHYAKVHGRRPCCIPNAVLTSPPREPQRIKQYGLDRRSYILYSGRLSPEKGVDVLLDAMRPLRGRIKLVLAGGSSYSDSYIESLHRAASDDVMFLGTVDRETMQELYSNCYAYVLPSVMEGLSIALLEAVSFGACIVTTNIPENVEVVDDAALTFTPGDTAALGEHLRRLLDAPQLATTYRQKAAAHAAAQPDWDTVAQLTEEFYYQILGARLAPAVA